MPALHFFPPRLGRLDRSLALMVMVTILGSRATVSGQEVSFGREVMAVLSRAGCNAGACHGNLNGKGGLRLSLRGQDPEADHRSLVRELGSRRLDWIDPEQSLLLLKATGQVSHQGGVRFTPRSPEYRLLKRWIAQGAPPLDTRESALVRLEVSPTEKVVIGTEPAAIPLQVVAHFGDGHRREVTGLAAYESSNLGVQIDPAGFVSRVDYGEATVVVRYLHMQIPMEVAFVPPRPAVPAAVAGEYGETGPGNYIDRLLEKRWNALRLTPADIAADQVFLRRVYLDTLGVLPTADEARAFLADDRPDRRARLIDHLLSRPEFAELWALRWSDILRNEEKVLDSKGVEVFHRWIRDSMAAGKPLDQFTRQVLRATGSTYENPPANFWRANRDAPTRAETVARLFLGVRLQCARCHNHPFDHWTQDDYYSWTALFSRIDYDIVANERKDKLDKNEFVGEQVVKLADSGGTEHPRTGRLAVPKMLGGEPILPGAYQDRLTPLALWLTAPENRLFARTMANFLWYHLMGRGLVEPIDDLRLTNPAANEPLLDALAADLVARHFDWPAIVRTILRSQAYQRSATPNDTNREDERHFSKALILRLPAEKLLDAQSQVLDSPAEFSGYPLGMRAGQLPGVRRVRDRDGVGSGDRFLRLFGKPERLLACECERSNETSLGQAFQLLSGEETQRRLTATGNRLDQWAASNLSPVELVTELYWTALSRPPTSEELAAAEPWLGEPSANAPESLQKRREGLQDLAWAVMNSKEFLFRW